MVNQKLDKPRVCAFLYACSLRLSQCCQICDFPSTVGPYYDLYSHVHPYGGRPLLDDCRSLLSKWRHRPAAISRELQRLVESVAGTATLKAAVGELVPLTDSLCTDQVPTTVAEEVGLELYGTTFFLAQARTICDSARQRLQALARTLSNEQTIKACSEWVDLGEHVAMFLSDEEQSLENSGDEIEPEDWTGFDYVHFSYLADQTFVRPNDSQRNVDRCCKAVHKPEEKLRPPLDERSVDQQEIIDLEIIPTSFAGWFQVEAGLWPLLYGKRNERQCAERDALFVRWKQEERAKQPNIYVMRRWNGLPEAERQRIAPDCWHDVSRNNVKEVLEIAELREKADELDRLKRIF